tara:strand:+ start:11548 stop:13209 length:1662 start_codon:yes stop_codon:yes gene_type:complete
MAANWFDLKDYDAKVERVRVAAGGHYALVLNVPEDRLPGADPGLSQEETLLDLGWELTTREDGRITLENQRMITSTRSVMEAMQPFFSTNELTEAHRDQGRMRQGERMEGLEPRDMVSMQEVESTVAGVEPENLDRILSSVALAQKARAERLKRTGAELLDGRGWELFEALTDAALERRPDLRETAAAIYAFGAIASAVDSKPQTVEMYGTSSAIRASLDELARGISIDDAELRQRAVDRLLNGLDMISDERRDHIERSYRDQVQRLPDTGLTRPRDVVLRDMLPREPKLTPAVMSGLELGKGDTEAAFTSQLPFKVRRDAGVPTRRLVQNMMAASMALDVISQELGIGRGELIPDQASMPLRFSAGLTQAGGQSIGDVRSTRSESTDEDGEVKVTQAQVMSVSVASGASFVHEAGHMIHNGYDLSTKEIEGILRESGVMTVAMTELNDRFPEGGKTFDYLSDPREIFARTFESHMVNVVRASGDIRLEALGGSQTVNPWDEASGRGDIELTRRFVDRLKDTITLKLDTAHAASRDADRKQQPSSAPIAAPQP